MGAFLVQYNQLEGLQQSSLLHIIPNFFPTQTHSQEFICANYIVPASPHSQPVEHASVSGMQCHLHAGDGDHDKNIAPLATWTHASRDLITRMGSKCRHLLLLLLSAAVSADESCHSFAGGSVYPAGTGRNIEHSLQFTKAVISKPAPHWEGSAVVGGEITEIKLSDYKGKYLVFFFYPLDFTFVCPTEILAFNDRLEEFKKINTEVVACSVDSHFTHHAWTKTPRNEGGLGKLKIPLLSDLNHKISKDYGVYLEDLGHTLR
ncbi:Hypothetical predicted protein [Cloeon dipterum]|nr:Hypothetical predicted protein [Cloeon dipterum]